MPRHVLLTLADDATLAALETAPGLILIKARLIKGVVSADDLSIISRETLDEGARARLDALLTPLSDSGSREQWPP